MLAPAEAPSANKIKAHMTIFHRAVHPPELSNSDSAVFVQPPGECLTPLPSPD